MFRKLRFRITYANVMATVAVFVALGGSSYAALQVGSAQIVNNSIRSKDIRNGQVTSRDLKNNDVRSGDVRNGSLLSRDFKAGELPAGPPGRDGGPGARGAPGPSNAYSAYQTFAAVPNGPGRASIAELGNLPAGDYTIFAKLYLTTAYYSTTAVANCRLEAGADYDESIVSAAPGASASMALNVVRSLAGPGSATLVCSDNDSGARANYIKITAIRADSVRNLPSPLPSP